MRRVRVPAQVIRGVPAGSLLWSLLVPGPLVVTIVVGAVVGGLGAVLFGRRLDEHRRRRLGFELPEVAEFVALHLLAGDSVFAAIETLIDDTDSIAAGELRTALARVRTGSDFESALLEAARTSVHPDAGRLYQLLSQAHRTGGSLIDALGIYAADRRSAVARDMLEEGGRRAIAGYGPILGLMVPTTLVFLIYPTVAGLSALARSSP
jgi:tight adherence protein C